jgi:hypothetical protein
MEQGVSRYGREVSHNVIAEKEPQLPAALLIVLVSRQVGLGCLLPVVVGVCGRVFFAT